MQLDYKDIILKHYALSMSGSEIARQTGFSKSGVIPSSYALRIVLTASSEDIMITGVSAIHLLLFIISKTSKPFIYSILISKSIRSIPISSPIIWIA